MREVFFLSTCHKISQQFNGFVQDCSSSIANALELLQSYTKPSNCRGKISRVFHSWPLIFGSSWPALIKCLIFLDGSCSSFVGYHCCHQALNCRALFFGSILNVKVLMAWQGMVCQVVIDRNDKVYLINAGIILCVGPANETQRYIVTSSLWLGAYKKMIPVMTHEGWFGIVKNAKILHSFHFISSVFFLLSWSAFYVHWLSTYILSEFFVYTMWGICK